MGLTLPTITQYIESVRQSYALFRTLNSLEYEKDINHEPKYRCGNNSVIFKILHEGIPLALKCYIKPPRFAQQVYDFVATLQSPYTLKAKLLPQEIYVYDHFERGSYHDIVAIPWAKGRTLEYKIESAAHRADTKQIEILAARFDAMALNLLAQPWAHGDVKPENIIVSPSMELTLIDYDAMFIPELAGEKSIEIGTINYQHYLRDSSVFDRHIDDYSLAIISVILHATALQPSIYVNYLYPDNNCFCSKNIVQGQLKTYQIIKELFISHGQHSLVALTETLLSPTPRIESLERIFKKIVNTAAINQADTTPPEPFNFDSKWGYTDTNGAIVINPIYDHVDRFYEGMAAVNLRGACQYIDLNGQMALECAQWSSIKGFSDSLAAVKINSKWGYINTHGKVVIDPIFEIAGSMHNGIAVAKFEGMYGYINTRGQWAIRPQFDYATSFNEGRAMVKKGERVFEIDKIGRKI